MDRLDRLQGMPDTTEESLASLRRLQDRLREFLSTHGYGLLETPILEPTELFLRKSGGELAARMYTFTDPGGNQVSLRPEYTSSVVRHYLEGDAVPNPPVRVQYSGPVFRYEDGSGFPRQFTQVGAELLGSVDARADAEVLSISYSALAHLGFEGHSVVMTDQGVLYRLLEALHLSERAVGFILSSVPDLREGAEGMARVQQRAKVLRLLRASTEDGRSVEGLQAEGARSLLEALMHREELGSSGQRDPAEIVDRLLRKSTGADHPARVERGLELTSRLAAIRGEPASSIARAEEVIKSSGLDIGVLAGIRDVIPLAEAQGLPAAAMEVDFGLARSLAYYTGTVFEITLPGYKASLGGGGRYDGLARALGGRSHLPALGFAYTAERLLEAMGSGETDGTENSVAVLVLATEGHGYREAAQLARELRRSGKRVEMDVCEMDLKQGLEYAQGRGIAEVVQVDTSGKATSHPVMDVAGRHRAGGAS